MNNDLTEEGALYGSSMTVQSVRQALDAQAELMLHPVQPHPSPARERQNEEWPG